MSTCLTCKHWLPRETPGWAVRMQMAVCALKQTKAVTMAHWHACPKRQQAEPKVAQARVKWLARVTAQDFPTNQDDQRTHGRTS
jgi:hypothetical protein